LPTVILALIFAIAVWGVARRLLVTRVHRLLLDRVGGSTGIVLAGGLRALAWGAAPIFGLLALYYAFTLQGLLPFLQLPSAGESGNAPPAADPPR